MASTPSKFNKIGTMQNGWLMSNDDNKRKQWIQLHGTVQSYEVHDNGSRPFLVVISDDLIVIFKDISQKQKQKQMHRNERERERWNKCMTIHLFNKVFVGKHSGQNQYTGNTILIQLSPLQYLYVGERIVQFDAVEPILHYESYMGNNDVPYPFAITEHYVIIVGSGDNYYTPRIAGDPNPIGSFEGNEQVYTTKFEPGPRPKVLVDRLV